MLKCLKASAHVQSKSQGQPRSKEVRNVISHLEKSENNIQFCNLQQFKNSP